MTTMPYNPFDNLDPSDAIYDAKIARLRAVYNNLYNTSLEIQAVGRLISQKASNIPNHWTHELTDDTTDYINTIGKNVESIGLQIQAIRSKILNEMNYLNTLKE